MDNDAWSPKLNAKRHERNRGLTTMRMEDRISRLPGNLCREGRSCGGQEMKPTISRSGRKSKSGRKPSLILRRGNGIVQVNSYTHTPGHKLTIVNVNSNSLLTLKHTLKEQEASHTLVSLPMLPAGRNEDMSEMSYIIIYARSNMLHIHYHHIISKTKCQGDRLYPSP